MFTQSAMVSYKPSLKVTQKVKREKSVYRLNRVNLLNFVRLQNGKFISVSYTKVSGETRTLTGRLGVKAFLKGGQNKVEALDRPYLVLFDIKLMQYRTVSLDTVSQIRAKNAIYNIVD